MSADADGTPAGSNSFKFVWIAVRLAAGALGVLTLLHVATFGLGIEYKDFFQRVLDDLRGLIELTPLLDLIQKYLVDPGLDLLRYFGWTIPELADHWRPVFTLAWLLMVATARNFDYGRGIVWQLLCAAVCALGAAIVAGTQALDSDAMFNAPFVSFILYGALAGLPSGWLDRGWLIILGSAVVTYAVAVPNGLANILHTVTEIPCNFVNGVAYAVGDKAPCRPSPVPYPDAGLDLPAVPSPLLGLALFVGAVGLSFFLLGLFRGGSTWRERWNNPDTATGLDIVGVMGTALVIGWLMLA